MCRSPAPAGVAGVIVEISMNTNVRHPLASLANVLFKNHFELQALLESLSDSVLHNPGGPLQVGLRMGSTGGNMSVGKQGDTLNVEFTEQGRAYSVQVPLKASATKPFIIEVALEENGEKKSFQFEGQSFWNAEVPNTFRSLHERVVRYLKSVLPAELRPSHETPPRASSEYRKIRIVRDDMPDLEFEGKLAGRVESALRNGRQTALTVFTTKGGKWVGVREGISFWIGEQTRNQAAVADSLEALVDFFGYAPIAKALYRQLGISVAETIA